MSGEHEIPAQCPTSTNKLTPSVMTVTDAGDSDLLTVAEGAAA